MQFLHQFLTAFIPLFVAIDVLAVVPLFVSFTNGLSDYKKNRLLAEAVFTAMGVSLVFLLSGKLIFKFLGITENDFRIGGGIVLLVLSVYDILFSKDELRRRPTGSTGSIGVVPIGIPLIIGPAALTTILISVDAYGYFMTILSLLVNLVLVWFVFRESRWVIKLVGEAGAKAFAKVASLFMCAIAIMMIRVGLQGIAKLTH